MNLLLKHVHWCSEGRESRGDVRLGRGRVMEVGAGLAPRRREHVLDLDGYLALPGLINAHDHLDLNLFPPLGEPPYGNFYAWGREIYRPEERPVRDVLAVPLTDRLAWSAYKQLVSGVTTVMHHNPYLRRHFDLGYPVRVVRRYGWAHSLGHEENVAALYGRSRGRPFVVHAAEGVDEVARAEIDTLDRLGVLATNTVLVHAVGATDSDVATLADRGVSVVWCPSSNLRLFGETAPVDRMKRLLRVALGTDSTLSGSPTMWDELRTAASTGMATPDEIVAMVTTTPANIFGLRDGRGTLRAGAPADVLVVPDTGATPGETLVTTSPAAVKLITVDGVPRLATPEIAARLDVGRPNACVDGEPRWLGGSPKALRDRIERALDEDILAANPLWALLSEPVAVATP